MKKYKTISAKNRNEWRRWLSKNFDTEDEIWLIFPKKSSGIKGIAYNDAVEEALCTGLRELHGAPDRHNSMTSFPYLQVTC